MGLNRVTLLGNLGNDPDLKYTAQQFPIASFSLAVNETRKNAQGQQEKYTEWFNLVAFGKAAENAAKYLSKGRQVFVEGRIHTEHWEDKEGKKRSTTKIYAQHIEYLGDGQRRDSDQQQQAPAPQSGPTNGGQNYGPEDVPF